MPISRKRSHNWESSCKNSTSLLDAGRCTDMVALAGLNSRTTACNAPTTTRNLPTGRNAQHAVVDQARDGARDDHPRQGRADHAGAGLPAGPRPPADRRPARPWQDHACAGAGRVLGLSFRRIQFTSDLLARRHRRRVGLSPGKRRVRIPARPGLLAADSRRRGQSRNAQSAKRAARGHGRTPGIRRWQHARAARAVLRRRDAEPRRPDRHLPAAGIAARPFPDACRNRLPERSKRTRADRR